MALPPYDITNRLKIRLSGYAHGSNVDAGVQLEVYVAIDALKDDWEVIKFYVREQDNLVLDHKVYIVEEIVAVGDNTSNTEDRSNPDAQLGISVKLVSDTNQLNLNA